MKEFFRSRKEEILRYLRPLVKWKVEEFSRVHPLGGDVVERILDFAGRGKMLRGGLVGLGYALYAPASTSGSPQGLGARDAAAQVTAPEPAARGAATTARGAATTAMPGNVVGVGAAMELFQSAFLIHDDIMDRDTRRRGGTTVFSQYVEAAQREGLPDAEHMGESLGICAGDIAFFLAYEILGRVAESAEGVGESAAPEKSAGQAPDSSPAGPAAERAVQCAPLFTLASRELSYVGVAQMLDVRWGNGADEIKEEDVLELYRYKTGRYTFSLPLSSGALLAGADEEKRKRLERIGELLGVVFQLRDDELGLFGDEEDLGKPIGSDIREGKRTPFFLALMDRVEEDERRRLLGIFGDEEASDEEIEHVRSLVEELGVRDEIIAKCEELSREARVEIEALEQTNPDAYRILEDLLDYGLNRKS